MQVRINSVTSKRISRAGAARSVEKVATKRPLLTLVTKRLAIKLPLPRDVTKTMSGRSPRLLIRTCCAENSVRNVMKTGGAIRKDK